MGVGVIRWEDIGLKKTHTGTEIKNADLASALQQGKIWCATGEWDEFKLNDLSHDSYIKVKFSRPRHWTCDDVYYLKSSSDGECLALRGRCWLKLEGTWNYGENVVLSIITMGKSRYTLWQVSEPPAIKVEFRLIAKLLPKNVVGQQFQLISQTFKCTLANYLEISCVWWY